MKIEKTVELSKETYELGEGLAKFIIAVRKAVEDGFSYGDDLPDIIASAVSDILPALDGSTEIGAEFKEDPRVFAQTVLLIGTRIVEELGGFGGRIPPK